MKTFRLLLPLLCCIIALSGCRALKTPVVVKNEPTPDFATQKMMFL